MPGKTNPRPISPEPHEGYVAVGRVRGPRGLEGELKVDPLSDYPKRFVRGATLRAGDRSYTVLAARMHQRALLLRVEGIATREQADELRGLLLEVPESELGPLAEGEYYRFQLIGLEVRDTAGDALGRLEEVLDTGANDVYIVRNDESELLVPAIEAVVKSVDLAAGTMVVEPLQGMERRPLSTRRQRRPPLGSESIISP